MYQYDNRMAVTLANIEVTKYLRHYALIFRQWDIKLGNSQHLDIKHTSQILLVMVSFREFYLSGLVPNPYLRPDAASQGLTGG